MDSALVLSSKKIKNFFFNPSLSIEKKFILALFYCSLIFYGFSLPFSIFGTPRFSPGNDFSNHAHFMNSFAESFKSGQIIPRTIAKPLAFSDATNSTENIPTFQYYGFFEGLVGLPFHLIGISDTNCAVLSSILIRFIGLLFLFETCLLLGASRLTSFLAAFSLLLSPYTLCVFYGRGSLAETFAQSLLILLPYGYALAWREKFLTSAIVYALAFALLSLCHNIFFLYGLLFLAVLTFFSFRIKIYLCSAIGTLVGILMSAWQWLPAQKTISDITIFGALHSWKLRTAGVESSSASLNGIFGFPQPFMPHGLTHPLPIYFTIGWWTLPFIILSLRALFQSGNRRIPFAFLMCSILFYCLTFQPINSYIYIYILPPLFDIVQDTSRLIGFLNILSAIGLAFAIPNISSRLFKILLIGIFISQIPVFYCYINLVSKKTWGHDEVLSAPINYYYTTPTINNSPKVYMSQNEQLQIKRSDGSFSTKNTFYVSPTYQKFFVRLAGVVGDKNAKIKLSIAALNTDQKTQDMIKITESKPAYIHSDFDKVIMMDKKSPIGWYKIIASSRDKTQSLASFTLLDINIIPNDLASFIPAGNIHSHKKHLGYARNYIVNTSEKQHFQPDSHGLYTLELPAAYSTLFTVKQNKIPLQFYPDLNHRILIQTNDITDPIVVSYHLDNESIILTCLGLLGFITLLKLKKSN